MNAIRLLLRQHDEIEALLRNLALADQEGRGARDEYLQQLTVKLHAHLQVEEEILYPAIAEQGSPALVEPSIREHEQIRELLGALREAGQGGAEWMERLRALEDAFVQHAGDEEVDLFPEVKGLFGNQDLDDLGVRMQESHEAFISAPFAEAPAASAEAGRTEPPAAEAASEEQREPSGPAHG